MASIHGIYLAIQTFKLSQEAIINIFGRSSKVFVLYLKSKGFFPHIFYLKNTRSTPKPQPTTMTLLTVAK